MSEPLADLCYEDFVRARKIHWKQEAKTLGSNSSIPAFDEVALGDDDSNFVVHAAGPASVFGVFEDAAETGWFYLFSADERRILKCTHVYNRSRVSVDSEDVFVVWSADKGTCAAAVWDQMRAFLGISNGVELRAPIIDKETPGFAADEWPDGFAHLLLRTEDSNA